MTAPNPPSQQGLDREAVATGLYLAFWARQHGAPCAPWDEQAEGIKGMWRGIADDAILALATPMSGAGAGSFYKGVRASIQWLHEHAASMNDHHARAVLNTAAYALGVSKPDPNAPASPIQTPDEPDLKDALAAAVAERDEALAQLAGHDRAMANERRRWREHPLMQRLDAVRQSIAGLAPHDAVWIATAQSEFMNTEARALASEAREKVMREALEKALKTLVMVDEQVGEGIHTGLRKGVDGKGSENAWRAIANMTDNGWSEALEFFKCCVGLRGTIDIARTALKESLGEGNRDAVAESGGAGLVAATDSAEGL